MTCAELDQRAVDYLYGELGAAARAEVEAHLGGCDNCRRELRALERTLGVTREALRGPLAQEAPVRVRAALEQEAARVAAQAAARRSPGGWASLTEWLRRPWFLPAVASFSVVALFFLARQGIVDAPRRAMQEAEQQAAPSAEPPVPAVVPALPPPAPGLLDEASPSVAEETAGGPRLGAAAPNEERKRAAPTPKAPAKAKREAAPSRRPAAVAPSASSRWASPPPAEPAAPAPVTAAAPAAPDDMPARRARTSGAEGGQLADGRADSAGKATATRRAAESRANEPGRGAGGMARPEAAPSMPPMGAAAPPPPAAAPTTPRPAPQPAPEMATAEAPASKVEEGESSSAGPRELSLTELRRRADLAFQQGRWERATRDYRELLRRFAGHADAPLWRRRLDISIQSTGR